MMSRVNPMRFLLLGFVGVFLFFNLNIGYAAENSVWKIKKSRWENVDFENYEKFIFNLGEFVEQKKCHTVDKCLKSAGNIYRGRETERSTNYFADCADLPYLLRAYFSWKNNLPFSYVNAVQSRQKNDETFFSLMSMGDIRYSPGGNRVVGRRDLVDNSHQWNGKSINAYEFLLGKLVDEVSSANYRMNYKGMDQGVFSDFYPVKITRKAVRPGTIIYDPAGHVALVYKVTDSGRIYYIDAHPDNSLTSGVFGPKFVRSNPAVGAGFKNWRPLFLSSATADAEGNLHGGIYTGAINSSLPDYGTEQFYGNFPDNLGNWKKGRFQFSGKDVDFYEYVRRNLAIGELVIKPVDEVRVLVKDLCTSLQDRVEAVNIAIKNKIQQDAHPERLPYNIYGSSGLWETYASPSRDARIRVSFVDLLEQIKKIVDSQRSSHPYLEIQFEGQNLARELLAIYQQESRSCFVQYTNSDNQVVSLNLESVRQRLFELSFDPYHCAELRWGATSSTELKSCRDDKNKRAWYQAERWLRNQTERRYDVRMDLNLSELESGPRAGVGVANSPDTDIEGYLKNKALE